MVKWRDAPARACLTGLLFILSVAVFAATAVPSVGLPLPAGLQPRSTAPSSCFGEPLVITDFVARGRELLVVVETTSVLNGTEVQLENASDGQVVGVGTIANGGAVLKTPLPSRRAENTARYEAIVPGVAASAPTSLRQRIELNQRQTGLEGYEATVGIGLHYTGIFFSGRVTGSPLRPRAPLYLVAENPTQCGAAPVVVGTYKIKRNGTFSVHYKLPAILYKASPEGTTPPATIYRLETTVAGGRGMRPITTFSLPLAVNL